MKERIRRKKINNTGVIILFAFSLVFLVFSCEKYSYEPPSLNPDEEISFQSDIIPIFKNNCVGCHGGSISPDLRAGNAYESLMDGYISSDPENDPESSEIYQKLQESSHSARASEIEKLKILSWIRQGAQNN